MKNRNFEDMRLQIAEAIGLMQGIQADLNTVKTPVEFKTEHEIELASDIEYVRCKLKALRKYLRSRQEDREDKAAARELGDDDDEGEEWKRGKKRRE